jgi:hypothetical protein
VGHVELSFPRSGTARSVVHPRIYVSRRESDAVPEPIKIDSEEAVAEAMTRQLFLNLREGINQLSVLTKCE